MKSNEQKLINLLVQSVLTVRTTPRLQQLTTEELVTWIRDNLTKLGFNVQEGNKFWIDYDGAQKIAEDVYRGATSCSSETLNWIIQAQDPSPDRNVQTIPLAILQEIRRLADFAIKKIEAIK